VQNQQYAQYFFSSLFYATGKPLFYNKKSPPAHVNAEEDFSLIY